ncbi:MAG: AAA family ATPase [Chitinivibrionales bacterium]|nr:AAA family ATPase [Chitinivibrionales bacterium]
MIDQARRLREMVRAQAVEGSGAPQAGVPAAKSAARKARSIAVTSGKGGVGKTNIALMLSVGLTRLKKKVLLLDADLGLANVHILFGIAPQATLSHVVEGEKSLQDVICSGPANFDILPGASGLERMANLGQTQLAALLEAFARVENDYDFMVIDTSAGIGATTTTFAAAADLNVLVLTPEPTSFSDAYAMVKVLREKNVKRIGGIVNMAGSDREGRDSFDRLNTLVVKFLRDPLQLLGILPFEKEVSRTIKHQKVFMLEHPRHVVSARIQSACRMICGLPEPAHRGFFAGLIHRAGKDVNV